MLLKGYPPGTTFDMICQKQEEEAETRSRQVAREKVQGWLETSESLPLSHGSDSGGEIFIYSKLIQVMTPIDGNFGGVRSTLRRDNRM
ncbi:hypothetical protein JVT61DRAFT_7036 [Boletus reticuloceps]|uniref:Uncharacterized protein n=1 Tax=Boletus reticuloceps TaxID=495285 RepID=A0A8I2YJH1_9AGAM|nr:hypothetical protein JVT61DRAFT_7036 [Boletus reticuloceps]